MEIHRWHCYIFINCAIIIPCFVSKPFSLNKVIAEELQKSQESSTAVQPKLDIDKTPEYLTLSNNKTPIPVVPKIKKPKITDNTIPLGKKTSFLKYRKTFQIKAPLKPKKIKHTHKPRYKRKNQSVKRETSENEKFNQKYIPLLKSLGLLFDDLFTSGSNESNKKTYKRNRYVSEERNDVICACGLKTESNITDSKPQKKTTTFTTSISTEVSNIDEITEATPTTSHFTPIGNISSFGQNKNIPILLTRDTFSSWGDHNGYNERSSSAFHRSSEGNISWNHRNNERNTEHERNETCSTIHDETSRNLTRDDASSYKSRRRIPGNRNDTNISKIRDDPSESYELPKDKDSSGDIGKNINESERKNKLEIRKDETKNAIYIPESLRRSRDSLSNKVNDIRESIQSQETDEESILSITHNHPNYKRITNRNGTPPKENKKTGRTNEAMITITNMTDSPLVTLDSPKNKTVVMIIDGYSITRNKNGENKLAEKSIRIRS